MFCISVPLVLRTPPHLALPQLNSKRDVSYLYNHKFKQVSCLTTKYCICKQNQVFGLYQDINKGTRTSDNDIVWWILAMTLTAWLQKRDSPIPHYVLPTLMNQNNVVYNVGIFINKPVENTGIFILANVRVLYMLDSFHFSSPTIHVVFV